MKRLLALAAALLLCLSLSACVITIPTDLQKLDIKTIRSATVAYPFEITYEDHITGTVTKTEYTYNREKGYTDLTIPVTVTVFENEVQIDTYEVEFDEFANITRIGDTTVENTYDENNRLLKSIYSENGIVTQIINREYDEKGLLRGEAHCDSEGVMVTYDLYTFEDEYGSYASIDHHDSNSACTGTSEISISVFGKPSVQEFYDLEGNHTATVTWQHFTHSKTKTVIK